MARQVKNLLIVQETWVWSPDREDPLKEGMATHYSIYYCWESPVNREAWQATVHGVAKNWTELKQLNIHGTQEVLTTSSFREVNPYPGRNPHLAPYLRQKNVKLSPHQEQDNDVCSASFSPLSQRFSPWRLKKKKEIDREESSQLLLL